MIIESVILSGGYVGIRFLKTYLKNKNAKKKSPQKVSEVNSDQNEIEIEQNNHYLMTSTLSVGLTVLRCWNPVFSLLSTGTIIYNSLPVFTGAERMLCEEKKVGNDVLVSISILMCLGFNYYFPLTVGSWFYFIGRKSISTARNHSEKKISEVFEGQSRTAWILQGNIELEIPLETLSADDVVVVNSGVTIPADGIIIDGMAMIDQQLLTGESQPTEKNIGDKVFASTLVISGKIYIRVEKTGKETIAAHIISILSDADKFKSTTQLKGEKWADAVAPPLMIMSGMAFPLLGPVGAIVILNSSIGNSIRVNAPLGTLNHITLASQKHILVKNGQALERLERIDTVLFDKTGTLTKEVPEVAQVISFNGLEKDKILQYAATAESKLSHPIAKAILKKAKEQKLKLPDINDSEYKIGYGITVFSEGKIIRAGSIQFFKNNKIVLPKEAEKTIEIAYSEGHSYVIIGVNNQVVGCVELRTSVRPEVGSMIKGLRERGIKSIYLVSGDQQQQTKKISEEFGLDGYFYDILPENKALIVEQFQREGKSVCFVGDGINDTIAMQQADISVSLRGASTIATDVAQIVLMDADLVKICHLFDLSKKLNKNLQTTLLISLTPAIINISGALVSGVGIMSSYIIKMSFFMAGMGNAMLPLLKKSTPEGNARLLGKPKKMYQEEI
ncbi:MAG: heavy metal translocating P-type ATPase [Candidatus Electrothrix sp. AX2]|nr:heavy metal translocating P-type ATPase [Candidatus Electrothrix gigas]